MKSWCVNLPRKPWTCAANAWAFTLTELMTSMAIFSLIVIAIVSLQVYGFKMSSLTESKLISVGYSLKALDQVCDQVRAANSVLVGNGNGSTFTASGTSGNAIQIYPTTNSNYIRFYLDTNGATLYVLNSTNNSQSSIASNIINQSVFQKVNYQGSISNNAQGHYAIKMALQFCNLDYRIPANIYDYYTLQATMTPRSQN